MAGPNDDTHFSFVNILHVVRLVKKFIRFDPHMKRKFIVHHTFNVMYQKSSLCYQIFRAISCIFKMTKMANFPDNLLSANDNNVVRHTHNSSKVRPSQVTQCVTYPSFDTNRGQSIGHYDLHPPYIYCSH